MLNITLYTHNEPIEGKWTAQDAVRFNGLLSVNGVIIEI
jgi:hypothetical protein